MLSSILDVPESITLEFDAAKPAGDANDAVGHVLSLENAENDQTRSGFTVVTFRFVDGALMADACGPAVVVGFRILLVSLEGFEELFDVFPTLHSADSCRIATATVFDNHRKERER